MAESDPELRCSDADRERLANELREHYAAGRLTLDEFHERSDAVYAAKTFGELARLTTDLPAAAVEKPEEPKRPARRIDPAIRGAIGSWLSVSLVCTAIWLLGVLAAGQLTYFWPFWVMGPWGLMVLSGAVSNRNRRRQGHDTRQVSPAHEEHRRRLEEYRWGAHGRYDRPADRHRQRQERHDGRHGRRGPHGEVK